MKFPQILKELRKEKNLTQAQLAKELNLSQPNIQHWEKGRGEPNTDMLIKLADFFDVTLDDLLGRQ